jgi:hypothetical protein
MARGYPGVVGAILGLPLVAVGAYVSLGQDAVPATVGIPLAAFGVFLLAIGLYVQFIGAPEPPQLQDHEELLATRTPAQRRSVVMTVIALPFLAGAVYLLFGTNLPYVYPTVAGLVGLYLFTTGTYTYWQNSLTTYYVTNERIITEYRFISLIRNELPFEQVRGVEERRSAIESLVGLGNVLVRSGGGATLEVNVRSIYDPSEFAETIRNQSMSQ